MIQAGVGTLRCFFISILQWVYRIVKLTMGLSMSLQLVIYSGWCLVTVDSCLNRYYNVLSLMYNLLTHPPTHSQWDWGSTTHSGTCTNHVNSSHSAVSSVSVTNTNRYIIKLCLKGRQLGYLYHYGNISMHVAAIVLSVFTASLINYDRRTWIT